MWETSKLSHFVQLSVFLSSELETKSIVTAWYWTLYQWVKQREHLGMNQNMQENRNIFYIFKIWLIVFISKRKNRCSSSLGTKYLFRSSYFFTKVNQQCGSVAKAFWRKSANAFLCDFCDVSWSLSCSVFLVSPTRLRLRIIHSCPHLVDYPQCF